MNETRQQTIRRELRSEYAQAACNEMRVARLRHEMGSLAHNHKWLDGSRFTGQKVEWGTRECAYCFWGTDEYLMGWDEIAAKVRESERVSDAIIEKIENGWR